eukprot:scaffold5343_cov179-Skeletonema_marinoi.AAC.4
MALPAAACNEKQGSEWGVAETYGVFEDTDTFLGGQISRGTAEGHSMDVIAVFMKSSSSAHGVCGLCIFERGRLKEQNPKICLKS